MTENEINSLIQSAKWIPLNEQLPPLNDIFNNHEDKPIPFASKGKDQSGSFILHHNEFLPGDEDILIELGVTHWMMCEDLQKEIDLIQS
ncbi:hypothetical protein [Acinetobacter sp. YH16053]|uniref:hypothetical protein n=1 Tax=Acinetobacter sp. YH16053 TaxID=2601192 RepID=UPI0015D2E04B|nr:hypothetical protein [Acinetobacter sp. YH16053]